MVYTKILKPLKEIITFSKIKKLLDITNNIFETLNNMEMGINILFENIF
jgi:hypothetical protein